MPIKIGSINIRRLYTDDELLLANAIRDNNARMEDIKRIMKLDRIELNKILEVINNDEFKISEITFETMRDYFKTKKYKREEDINKPDEYYRDRKKVSRLDKFIKKNDKFKVNEFKICVLENEELFAMRKLGRKLKKELNEKISEMEEVRTVKSMFANDMIALSQSELTDAMKIENDSYSEDIVIIVSDQEKMMKQIIEKGFKYNSEEYVLYTSSAGQLRKKKLMFAKKTTLSIAMGRLTCGLSFEEINAKGGININKWSAYLALPVSSTEIWEGLDIERVCVIDDWETTLYNRDVDHINSEYEINRTKRDVVIPHTDGFGMMHPSFCRDTRMIRAPWIKGLLAPFDFRSFVKTFGGKEYITDIYGVRYHVNDVDVILTKSQFKMHKFYDSWEDYKNRFYENGCVFRFMNPESKKDLRLNAKFNYQMWNTLKIDNKKEFADKLLNDDKDLIVRAHTEVGAMLEVFHVDKEYNRNNNMQKSLYLYPSMLATKAFNVSLRDKVRKKKNEMRQGRIKVGGVYTYLIPDIFAWCEHLFLGIENPKGLLADGEVSCKLVSKGKDVMVLRSPHLYREHCVRRNIKDKSHIRWFIGKGVYTSSHDTISKQLFFDNDGDISLVVENDELVSIAKETMKNIVPLDFELSKAGAQEINPSAIHESYTSAFKANIGYYSNLITKVVNGDDRDFGLVAKICWINNQIIDYAKTNWKQEPTPELNEKLKELDSRKLPYFFIWAKEKLESSVASPNKNSVVDQMALSTNKTESVRYGFGRIEKFNVENLLYNKDVEPIDDVVELFKELSQSKHRADVRKFLKNGGEFEENLVNAEIEKEMNSYIFNCKVNRDDAIDSVVKYVFDTGNDKDTLFVVFGDDIVERLEKRFKKVKNGDQIRCEVCGKLVDKNSKFSNTLYCDDCKKKKSKEKTKNRVKKHRKSKKA